MAPPPGGKPGGKQRAISSFFAPKAAAPKGANAGGAAAPSAARPPAKASAPPTASRPPRSTAVAAPRQRQQRARKGEWAGVDLVDQTEVDDDVVGGDAAVDDAAGGTPATPLTEEERRARLRASLGAPSPAAAANSGAPSITGEGGEPFYQPPPGARGVEYTPLEQQVLRLQREHPGVLLLVEVGYKYQFFGKDAAVASECLGIAAYVKGNFLSASVPTHRLEVHCKRLVEAGHKVGVVRQDDTAALKAASDKKSGPFSRQLSAIYTAATLAAQAALGASEGELARKPAGGFYGGRFRGRFSGGGGGGSSGGTNGSGPTPAEQYASADAAAPADADAAGTEAAGADADAHGNKSSDLSSFLLVVATGQDKSVGVVAIECSTGEVSYGSADSRRARAEVEGRVIALAPREVVLVGDPDAVVDAVIKAHAASGSVRVERETTASVAGASAAAAVADRYCEAEGGRDVAGGLASLANADDARGSLDQMLEDVMRLPEVVLTALAAGLKYLAQFKLAGVTLASRPRPYAEDGEMRLSANALRQLEVLTNSGDGTERGSLVRLLDRTLTAAGGRMLRRWITRPLARARPVIGRHEAVECLAESLRASGIERPQEAGDGAPAGGTNGDGANDAGILARTMRSTLRGLPDVERALMRVVHQTATPRELVGTLRTMLTAVRRMRECAKSEDALARSQLLRGLVAAASDATVETAAAAMLAEVNEAAATAGDKLEIFSEQTARARFPELAQRRDEVSAAEAELENLLPELRRVANRPSIKYRSLSQGSSKTEYLVEVPVSHKVPSAWLKVNTTKQFARYHPPEVIAGIKRLACARERRVAAANLAWAQFVRAAGTHYAPMAGTARALAELDALLSLATVAEAEGFVRPHVPAESAPVEVRLEGCWHPVLSPMMGGGFVPNDYHLGARPAKRCHVITGPNMGGKSTSARSLALSVVMSQAGSFVPCARATLSAMDGVFTRMGASDNILMGRSTFLEELTEASSALSQATERSLVILDELGRGTATYDGAAIAYSTLSYLVSRTRCLCLFATHYPDIVRALAREHPDDVGTFRMDYVRDVGAGEGAEGIPKITLLYRVVPGIADRSFGVSVARMAGVPESVVAVAAAKAKEFEEATERARAAARRRAAPAAAAAGPMGA
eukprot:PRCOL_00004183-RA